MAESNGLLNRRTGNNRYRGFESLSLRHFLFPPFSTTSPPRAGGDWTCQTDHNEKPGLPEATPLRTCRAATLMRLRVELARGALARLRRVLPRSVALRASGRGAPPFL